MKKIFISFIFSFILVSCGNVSDCECEQLAISYAYVSATNDFDYENFDSDDWDECFERYINDDRRGEKSGLNRGVWGTSHGWFKYLCENEE